MDLSQPSPQDRKPLFVLPGNELAHRGDESIDALSQTCIFCARLLGQLLDPLLQPSIALAQFIAEIRDLHAQLADLPLRVPPQLLILLAILLPFLDNHRGNVLHALESLLDRHISIVQ